METGGRIPPQGVDCNNGDRSDPAGRVSRSACGIAGREAVDWTMVLSGGDDYELCLVVRPEYEDKLMALAGKLELPLTHIGVIEAGDSLNIVDQAGARYLLDHRGYEHFSR